MSAGDDGLALLDSSEMAETANAVATAHINRIAQRNDLPPTMAFSWLYKPPAVIARTTKQISPEKIIQLTQFSPTMSQPVMSKMLSPQQSLNVSTGLTPDRAVRYRNSWTVRAAIGRATNWKVDSSQI